VFCAIVSHPADTVVSKLNNDVGSTPIQAARDLGMKGKWSMQTAFNPVGVGFCTLYLFFLPIALLLGASIFPV